MSIYSKHRQRAGLPQDRMGSLGEARYRYGSLGCRLTIQDFRWFDLSITEGKAIEICKNWESRLSPRVAEDV